MLKIAKIALVVGLLSVLVGASSAQHRRHVQPNNPSGQRQQTTGTNQTGTEQSPFVVKIIPTPATSEETAKLAAQETSKANTDLWLTRFTGGLVVVAIIQTVIFGWVFGWQGIQLRNAVRASSAEFLASHRPKVRLKHLWLANDIWAGEKIVLDLTAVNTGTAEGAGHEVGIKIHIVKADWPLPPDPAIPVVANFEEKKLVCGKNLVLKGLNTGVTLTSKDSVEIQNRRSKLYCVGYISYSDGGGRMRITGFCRVLTWPANILALADNCRFRRFRDPDFEYED